MNLKHKIHQKRILSVPKFAKGTDVSELVNDIRLVRGSLNCYLEIGVEYGRTLESVKAKYRIGIDPLFRFNQFLRSRTIELFEMKSNDFFHFHQLPHIDVAFLDGFHSGSQTYADFVNLLPYLSESSVVIIDDVLPSDIHSSLKSPEEAYNARLLAGVANDFRWHGDVFNAIFAIILNFPKLIYFTISDIENPVTIFYNFTRVGYSETDKSYVTKVENSFFLKNNPILIPEKFMPISKKEFLDKIAKYFKNLA